MRIYGLAEIARECGKSVDAVRKWQQRGAAPGDPKGSFPTHTAHLVAGYVWTGPEIEDFLARHRKVLARD